MKKLILATLVLFLISGCSDAKASQIDDYIEKMKRHAETAGSDVELYLEDLRKFNELLEDVDGEFKEYAELQIKSNNLRIEGLTTEKYDLITESSLIQARAWEILDDIKEE